MHLSLSASFCFLSTLLNTRCLAIDSSHPQSNLRGSDGSIITTSRSSGRRVNQVYLEGQDGMDEILVSTDSIPLPVLPSRGSDRRKLSFWSSILNFLKCPPGFHNDDNIHCHHHHDAGAHTSSSGGGGGGGGSPGGGCGDDDQCDETKDDDDDNYLSQDDDGGCGGDDDGCKDGKDDDFVNRRTTPSPTVFEDNISNDHSCWWCGKRQRNNDSSANGANGSYSSPYTGGTSVAYGAVAIAGSAAAVIAAILLKKKRDSWSDDKSANDHLLRGAVGKRKKKVSILLDQHETIRSTSKTQTTEDGVHNKRKGFLSRIVGNNRGKNMKTIHPTEETPGSHYVKV